MSAAHRGQGGPGQKWFKFKSLSLQIWFGLRRWKTGDSATLRMFWNSRFLFAHSGRAKAQDLSWVAALPAPEQFAPFPRQLRPMQVRVAP